MGWRFRRRVTLFPGVRINLSGRGISTTFGVPGASINIGSQGAYLNAGIPGTGLYNRVRLDSPSDSVRLRNESSSHGVLPTLSPDQEDPRVYFPEEVGAIKSMDNESIASEGLKGVKETLYSAFQERNELNADLTTANAILEQHRSSLRRFQWLPFHKALFPTALARREGALRDSESDVEEIKQRLAECKVKIDVDLRPELHSTYEALVQSFERLAKSQMIWDVTAARDVDRFKERSAASASYARKPVVLSQGELDFVNSPHPALKLMNANGADLFVFPAFLLMHEDSSDFALVGLDELTVEYANSSFVEEEAVPRDSKMISSTWKYSNKDGSRDKRFAQNFEIPVMRYGEIRFGSKRGMKEVYLVSDAEAASSFVEALNNFIRGI